MGSLNAVDFAAASAALKLGPAALDAAKKVLVDGEAPVKVAEDAGETRQNVHYWVRRVAEVHDKQQQAMLAVVPDGWHVNIIAAPPARMRQIVALADADLSLYQAGEMPQ